MAQEEGEVQKLRDADEVDLGQETKGNCRSIPIVVGALALGLANWGQAAGLFLPVADNSTAPATTPYDSMRTAPLAGPWERRVRIARPELTAARDDVANAGAGRLLLNVRDGVRLDVVVERTAPTRWGYSLSGRVAGRNGGFVTLVVHEEAVAGSIWTPNSAYELSYLGGGVHALRDVTNTRLAVCGGGLPAAASSATGAPTAQSGADDGSVVDILVVWTPAAEEVYGGGKTQVLSRIEMLIAYANDAFERSGAFVSLNLVGAERVDYMETTSGVDLGRLAVLDDGHMDDVHERRDSLGADLVYLLVSGGRGIAQLSGPFSVGTERVVTFAHEVGHNFGIEHERYEFNLWNTRYQHGFTTGACEVTIMSYGTECYRRRLIPFYASPWRYSPRDGSALGVTRFSNVRGVRGPADAVLTLNRNRHPVANFRPSRKGE